MSYTTSWDTIESEFSDIPDAGQLARITVRLLPRGGIR